MSERRRKNPVPASSGMDLYSLLGVLPEASELEIKHAYRKLAVDLHPDRNPDESVAVRFKEITNAYQTLSSPAKRKRYDDERRRALEKRIPWKGPLRRERGADLRYRLTVPFQTGVKGGAATIDVRRKRTCPDCKGSGADKAVSVAPPCRACDGAGRIVAGSKTRPCERCQGRGIEPIEACRACDGEGRYERNDTLEVPIPGGVDPGRRLRLAGWGDDGVAGGETGDLFVIVGVGEHPLLRLGEAFDVECDVPVSWPQAMLGAKVPVPTVDGVLDLDVPAGTFDGAVLRLAGRGAIKPDGSRGDQLVHVEVVMPADLTPEQKAALDAFAKTRPASDEPKVKAYLDALAKVR